MASLTGNKPSKDFWNGKKVLITGHTGFKGTWLSMWLKSLGAEVTGYSLGPPSNPSLFEETNIKNSMHSITGDIIDGERLLNAIVSSKANIVFDGSSFECNDVYLITLTLFGVSILN